MRYVAMFVLPLAIAVLLHQVYYSRKDKVEMVQTITSGTSKAILILADGLPVVLEQQQEKTLKESDGTKINVLKEHISYERGVDDKQEKSVYHELVIPRGGEFSLTLSDGTEVYMNADSKLRFPTKFGTRRNSGSSPRASAASRRDAASSSRSEGSMPVPASRVS